MGIVAVRVVTWMESTVSSLPGTVRGWSRYGRVDVPANRNLVDEAERAGVQRFVYMSVAHAESLEHLDYVGAHVRVERELRARGAGEEQCERGREAWKHAGSVGHGSPPV